MVQVKRRLRKMERERLRQKVRHRRNKASSPESGSSPFRIGRAGTPMTRNAEDRRLIERKKETQLKEDEKLRARIAAQRQGTSSKARMWHTAKEWISEYRTRNADSERVIALKLAARQKWEREKLEKVRARQERELGKSLPTRLGAKNSLRAAGGSILEESKPWRKGKKNPSSSLRPSKRRTTKFPLLSYA
mmetsp:Transcript_1121/g.1568  ORF Transcript_1121/g.1568 Transcript_1121/m.1568 type:complete len:191 (+) Transcript_1121:2-574(+)